jgi:hypothetical protein
MKSALWKTQLLGDIHNPEEQYELSVVREDYECGHEWGWGGTRKIILFDSVGSNDLERNKEDIDFAMNVANRLRDSLQRWEESNQ